MASKNVQLKKKIAGILTEIFPKTLAALVKFDDGKNAAEKVAEILTLIYGKTDMAAVETRIQQIIGSAPAALDTLNEIAAALNNDPNFAATITNQLANKVDKVNGKGLSTEDFTAALKTKLETLKTSFTADDITETAGKVFVTPAEKTAIASIGNKVDKIAGKGLSTEDYTTAEKNKAAAVGRIIFGADPGDLTENDILLEEIV